MANVDLNVQRLQNYPFHAQEGVIPNIPKAQAVIPKSVKIAITLLVAAGAATGSYAQMSLGISKGFLIAVPLGQLGRLATEGKVKFLRRPEIAFPVSGFLFGQGAVMLGKGMSDYWNGVNYAPLSWTESGCYMAFTAVCVAATEAAIQYKKAQQKEESASTKKVEAEKVANGQS